MYKNIIPIATFAFVLLMLIPSFAVGSSVRTFAPDFYDDSVSHGVGSNTEILGGGIQLSPISKIISDTTSTDRVTQIYRTSNSIYYGTTSGRLYRYDVDSKATVTLKDAGTSITSIDVSGVIIAFTTNSALWIYQDGAWSSHDLPDGADARFGYSSVSIGKEAIVAITTDQYALVYDISSKTEVGSYFIFAGLEHFSYTHTSTRGGGPLGWFYKYEQTWTNSGERLKKVNAFDITSYNEWFIVTLENTVVVFTLDDLVPASKDVNHFAWIDTGIEYEAPEGLGTMFSKTVIYPDAGVAFTLGHITLKWDLSTGSHTIAFDQYNGDDRMIEIGYLDYGHYIYFPYDKTYFIEEQSTTVKHDQKTASGDLVSVRLASFIDKAHNALMWVSNGVYHVGHYEYRNYEANGTFLSTVQDCRYDEQKKVMLASVHLSWDASVPPGTDYAVYVSNDNGLHWYNVTTLNGQTFDNWTKTFDNNRFRYKVTMWSPQQISTPVISNFKFILKTYAPAVVKIDYVEPTPSLVPVNFTCSNSGDVDDLTSRISWFNWSFGEPESQLLDGEVPYYNSTLTSNDYGDDFSTSHIYAKPGNYTVTLRVCDSDGYVTVATRDVIILNRPPIPVTAASVISGTGNVIGDIVSVRTGSEIQFSGRNSYDKDGTITSYTWDTAGQQLSSPVITHKYDTAGNLSARLIVEDDYGSQNSSMMDVYVRDGDLVPIAAMNVPSRCVLGDGLHLDGSGSWDDTGIVNYTWDISGKKVYGVSPTYYFSDGGTYYISLTVRDKANQTSSTKPQKVIVQYWPTSGDWIINSHVRVHDVETDPAFYGNVIVLPGGYLEMIDTKFVFGCHRDGEYTLNVKDGGHMSLNDSTLDTLYYYIPGTDMERYTRYHFNYICAGTLSTSDSAIYALNTAKDQHVMGLTLDGSKATLSDTTIARSMSGLSTVIGSADIYLDGCELYNIDEDGTFINSDASLHVTNSTLKACGSGISMQRGTLMLDNSIVQYSRNSGIYLKDTNASITNSILKYNGQYSISVNSGSETVLEGLTVAGSGSTTHGLDCTINTEVLNSSFSLCYIGGHPYNSDLTFTNCQFSNNRYDYYAESGRVYIKNFLTAKITYLGSPVEDALLRIYSTDALVGEYTTDSSGQVSNVKLLYGSSPSDNFNLSTVKTSVTIYCEDPPIFEDNRTVNMSKTHTELWTYGVPSSGGAGNGAGNGSYFAWLPWVLIVLLWVGLITAWYFKILNLSLPYVIGSGLALTALIVYFMLPSLFPYMILGLVWAGVGLMWYFEMFTRQIKTYITAGAGVISAGWLYLSDFSGFASGMGDYMPMLAALAVIGVSGALYWLKGVGQRYEVYYWGGSALAAAAAYYYLSGNMVMIYMGVLLAVVAGVGYFMIKSDANISFGAAALILGLIAITGLIIAYMLGIWYPGMIISDALASGSERAHDSLTPGWWPW